MLRLCSALVLCALVACKSTPQEIGGVRGQFWSMGAATLLTDGNRFIIGGVGSGEADLTVYGVPIRHASWTDNGWLVFRAKPHFRESFSAAEPVPSWMASLFPLTVPGDDGLLHATLANGLVVLIEPEATE